MNAKAELLKRVNSGQMKWAGPVCMVLARSVFLLAAQALVSIIFILQHDPHPFQAAAKWWTVWATLADLGCLILLVRLTRREGIRLLDLMGPGKKRLSQDLLLGLGLFVGLLPVAAIGGIVLGDFLVYGTWWPSGALAGFAGRMLPLWAVVYTRLIWWPLWSWTEQMTYNGYALPRLQVLTGRSWTAVALVALGWSLQHLFLPMLSDWRYLLWRFIIFIPFNVALPILYLRLRRLTPLVMVHWGLDFLSALVTTV